MKTARLIWAFVDLDGTLADTKPPHFDLKEAEPIKENLVKLDQLIDAGYKIWIHTSRHDDDYQEIEDWLERWNIPFRGIRTGKPLGALYIDDKARNASDSWI